MLSFVFFAVQFSVQPPQRRSFCTQREQNHLAVFLRRTMFVAFYWFLLLCLLFEIKMSTELFAFHIPLRVCRSRPICATFLIAYDFQTVSSNVISEEVKKISSATEQRKKPHRGREKPTTPEKTLRFQSNLLINNITFSRFIYSISACLRLPLPVYCAVCDLPFLIRI